MKIRRWRGLVGAIGAAIVVAIAVKIAWFPDAWELRSTVTGGPCTVRRGWSQSDVALACGPPDAVGMRPKVADEPSPHEWISFCSPPCEQRRGLVVLYDCNVRVADVARVTSVFCGMGDPGPIQRPLAVPPKQ